MRTLLATTLMLGLAALVPAQGIGGSLNVTDSATEIREQLGYPVPKDLVFTDDSGQKVKLGDYFSGQRPIILNLGYFGCPSLCGAVTNAMVDALKAVEQHPSLETLVPGRDFTILSVSFDPAEQRKPHLVEAKKENYLKHYGRPDAKDHWHFLVGDEENIKKLTKAVGFGFRWNQTAQVFDHRAALIFLSPDGEVTRYLYNLRYVPKTFRLALVEASDGKVGTTYEKFFLSCYGYDPTSGEYSRIGPLVMSIGGALTLLALGGMLFFLFRGDRKERRQPTPVTP
ncbi:MAG: SCO family protein [Planctomycetota bacterium]